MDDKTSKNYLYYKIPAELAESGKPSKALLYGLIVSLTRNTGICTASNVYLAKKIGRKDKSIISKYLQELKREGWIEINQNQELGNRRQITLSPLRKNTMTPNEKYNDPSSEKPEESNISISKIIKEYNDPPLAQEKIKNQEEEITALMNYYKEKAREKHNLKLFIKQGDRKNKKMRDLFRSCLQRFGKEEKATDFIDWWLEDNGKWASYLPGRAFCLNAYQEFENRNRITKLNHKRLF